MNAIDDGITSGHVSAADLFFLLAFLFGIIAAGVYAAAKPTTARWGPVLLAAAVASIGLALFLL